MRDLIDAVNKNTRSLIETPISTSFQGTEEPGSFRDDDRQLMASDKGQEKITRIWRNSIVDFDLVYLNRPMSPSDAAFDGRGRYGPIKSDQLKQRLNVDLKPRKGVVTLIFTHNEGSDRVPLTGWIIAHRAYHVFEEASRNTDNIVYEPKRHIYPIIDRNYKATYNWVSRLQRLGEPAYGQRREDGSIQAGMNGTLLANAIGTTKAARDKRLTDMGELKHEAFAQYLLSGTIRFNDPPAEIKSKDRTFYLDPERAEELTAFVQTGPEAFKAAFDKMLGYAKGKMFIL